MNTDKCKFWEGYIFVEFLLTKNIHYFSTDFNATPAHFVRQTLHRVDFLNGLENVSPI